jgi:3-oxoacyl-[acyl-carrier protein] reductase
MTSLEGKVAVITGSSRGLGAAIAKDLASNGAKVVVNYLNSPERAEQVVLSIKDNGGDAFAVQADMGTVDGPKKLVTEAVKVYSKIDIIVNNGALWNIDKVGEIEPSTFDRLFAVNVRGPLLLVQESLPYLQEHGRIINISSIAARAGRPASSVYGGTKAALEAMSRAWASELGPQRKITSNCVSVGPMLTEMIASQLDLADRVAGSAALRRIANTSDVSDIVSFLASEQSHWITGDVISGNGGTMFL